MKIKISVLRKANYKDLQQLYENKIDYPCAIKENQTWIIDSFNKPSDMCESAWESMSYFIKELFEGKGNFYDGWMKNPYSACISCNDGFRPVSFLIEIVKD